MKYTYKELYMQETHRGVAYAAEILLDGAVIAEVENDGIGGCNTYWVENHKEWATFVETAKATFPKLQFEQEDALVEALWEKTLS